MNIVTISSKNQITLPKDLLYSLGVGKKSQLLIDRENENIILKPLKKSIVDELAGSLTKYIPKNKLGVPFAKVREETQKIAARELAEK